MANGFIPIDRCRMARRSGRHFSANAVFNSKRNLLGTALVIVGLRHGGKNNFKGTQPKYNLNCLCCCNHAPTALLMVGVGLLQDSEYICSSRVDNHVRYPFDG